MTWPEALVSITSIAGACVFFWLILRGEDK